MRILHTADWHLGRTLCGASLLDDQAALLADIVRIAGEGRVDLVIVAGDLFDRSVPPVEAVELLDEVFCRLCLDRGLPVLALAGNHDSPKRLAFGARMLRERGLHLVAAPEDDLRLRLADAHGPIEVVACAYAEPAAVRISTSEPVHDQQSALRARLTRLAAEPTARRIFAGHLFLAGGQECEAERPLSIGGASAVGAHLLAGFDYAALGHLHRPQAQRDGRLRYSGSLMRYGFDECDQEKSLSLVEIGASGQVAVETVALRPPRDLARLRGSLAELLRQPRDTSWMAVELTDERAIFDAEGQLREAFPNLLMISRSVLSDAVPAPAWSAPGPRAERSMPALFDDFVAATGAGALDAEERTAFAAAWEDWARAERAES